MVAGSCSHQDEGPSCIELVISVPVSTGQYRAIPMINRHLLTNPTPPYPQTTTTTIAIRNNIPHPNKTASLDM
jgi:hypothetical protein